MARRRGWLGRLFDNVFGPTPPPTIGDREPPRPPLSEDDINYTDEERETLRVIDSYQLDRLPDRIDRKGNSHKAEFNRNRVIERLREEPLANLRAIQRMSRDEFRAWARATGFFYH